MSDMFKDLMDKAKNALDPIVDKAKEVAESGELKDKAQDILEGVKEKAGALKDTSAAPEDWAPRTPWMDGWTVATGRTAPVTRHCITSPSPAS